jgi:uncharacterized phage infection (PIP) family protein YhgE
MEQALMETLMELQGKLAHLMDVATTMHSGMQTIAGGVLTLQTALTDQASLIQSLKEQLTTLPAGAVVTQDQLNTLGAVVDTMQVTLEEALGHEQALEQMVAQHPAPPAERGR